jgi:hypothetical protein
MMPPFYFPVPFVGKKRRIDNGIIDELSAEDLPKEFDFFCPACLYQTNDFTVLCPKCGHEGLEESGKDRFRKI